MDTQTQTKIQTKLRDTFGKLGNINLEINSETVSDIYFAFAHFFPEGVVYQSDKPYSKGKFYWNNKQEFIEYVKEQTGIEIKGNDQKSIKKAQDKFFDISEGKAIEAETKAVEPPKAPVEANTLSSEKLEQLEKEDEAREIKRKEADAIAQEKQASFEKRLEQVNARLWAKKTKDLDQIQITPTNKEFIHNMAQAATLDPETTQKHVEELIKSSIPESEIENYPENLIKNRAHSFVQNVQTFSQYKSSQEIPDTFIVTPPYSPLTALINPNDQKLVDVFADKFVRENVASDAQQVILTLSAQRDLDAEIFEPSVFGGDNNLTQVFFGGNEITKFDPGDTPEDGIEITVEDLKSLHQNSTEIQNFFKKYIEIDGGGAEVISTGFTPLRIPESELKSVETSKVIGKKQILGGIEGEQNQGALARRIAREKAKLIDNVVTFNPNSNLQVVNQTKSILSKISGEVVPKTIIRNATVNPIKLGVNIGGGIKPITLDISGNFGGSTESFLKLIRDTNTPLMLTSIAVGGYAISDLAITSAIASQFNGQVLAYIGAGRYSFSVVNAGNIMLGGQPLSRYLATLQLGGKSLGIEITKKAGKVISSTLIKTGAGAVTRTALPAFLTKIISVVGGATGPVGLAISTAIGFIIGKIINLVGKIIPPEKLKKWGSVVVGTIAGLIALPFFGIGGAITAFAGTTILSSMLGAGLGGFSAASGASAVVSGVSTVTGAIFATAWAGIGAPILFILLGFPVIIALILFIINSGAYVVPPSPLSGTYPGSFSSPYIDVQKTAEPPGPFKNSDLPKTIKYTITIKPKKGNLTNIKISDKCEVVSKTKTNCPPSGLASPPEVISATSSYSFSYTMAFDSSYSDSTVINTITVTADEPSQAGATASISNSITIGNPPISCPLIGGHVATPSLNYSYNGANNTGHGSQAYWSTGINHYSIPQSSGCMSPSDCSYYGYAYDVFPSSSTDVFAPTVLGKDTSWNCSYAFSNGGGSAGYTYHCLSTDGNYMLVLTHMNKNVKTGTVKSGEKIGTLFNQAGNTHLHIEFQINGRYVKPENYFCGGK